MKGNSLWRAVLTSTVLSLGGWAIVAQQPRVAFPMVASAQVPLYPQVARIANVQGVVHIKVTTDGHRVVSAQVEDGNKLLSAPAEENIRTWQFSVHESTTFTVTYTYKLVTDLEAVQNNPRVLLKLPTEVEVDALRWPGTVDTPGEIKQNPPTPTTH
jgi:hypothetical protein